MKMTKAKKEDYVRLTRRQAIRKKCLDCCCDFTPAVKECTIKECPLWCYRMGYEVDINGKKIAKPKKDSSEDED